MDKNEKIAVGIGAAVLAVLALCLFLARGCMDSNDNNDAIPETDTIITDDAGGTGSGETFDIYEPVSVYDVSNSVAAHDEDKKAKYYLKLDNDVITIYKENGEFYDYARIDMAYVPQDVLGELKMGMEITGEDSLYEFLQGYAN